MSSHDSGATGAPTPSTASSESRGHAALVDFINDVEYAGQRLVSGVYGNAWLAGVVTMLPLHVRALMAPIHLTDKRWMDGPVPMGAMDGDASTLNHGRAPVSMVSNSTEMSTACDGVRETTPLDDVEGLLELDQLGASTVVHDMETLTALDDVQVTVSLDDTEVLTATDAVEDSLVLNQANTTTATAPDAASTRVPMTLESDREAQVQEH